MTEAIPAVEGSVSGVANVAVSQAVIGSLRGTRGWVRLIGILLCVVAVFTALASLMMLFGGAFVGKLYGVRGGGFAAVFGLVYVGIAALYGFMGWHLIQYASSIAKLAASGSGGDLELAVEAQRKFWKLAGVVALVMLVVMVAGIVAAVAIPLMLR